MGSRSALWPCAFVARRLAPTCASFLLDSVSFLLGIAPCLPACEYEPPSTGGSSASVSSSPDTVQILDDNNFSVTAKFSLGTPVLTAVSPDVVVSWEQLSTHSESKDLQCYSIDAEHQNSIDLVTLAKFEQKTQADVEELLDEGNVTGIQPLQFVNDASHPVYSAKLSEFYTIGVKTFLNVEKDYAESDTDTYLLAFNHGTTPGKKAKSLMVVKPSSDSNNLKVEAPSGCDEYQLTAKLPSSKVKIAASGASWTVDWSKITKTGQGSQVVFKDINELWLAHYEASISELEAGIKSLDTSWQSRWMLTVRGALEKEASLELATDKDAKPFGGFTTTTGTWILALLCGNCANYPVPVVLAVLNPT